MTDTDNEVFLRGRVSDAATERILPSGDEIVAFRLIVDRSRAARKRSRQSVDTFDCTVWKSRLRAKALRLAAGARIEVSGELRRQFARGPRGLTSRVFVDVGSLTVLPSASVTSSP